jgi:hypothetical protein
MIFRCLALLALQALSRQLVPVLFYYGRIIYHERASSCKNNLFFTDSLRARGGWVHVHRLLLLQISIHGQPFCHCLQFFHRDGGTFSLFHSQGACGGSHQSKAKLEKCSDCTRVDSPTHSILLSWERTVVYVRATLP